jgi:hypothetical protein
MKLDIMKRLPVVFPRTFAGIFWRVLRLKSLTTAVCHGLNARANEFLTGEIN